LISIVKEYLGMLEKYDNALVSMFGDDFQNDFQNLFFVCLKSSS